MLNKHLLYIDEFPDNLLSNLENRDVALWIVGLPKHTVSLENLLSFIGLPWKLVISEISDPWLVDSMEDPSKTSGYMMRKRGFPQVVDSDPSRIQFPKKCLPIYLLNGRQRDTSSNFEAQLRRLTMLEALRSSIVKEIVIISGECDPIPSYLNELCSSGFRSYLTFASDYLEAKNILEEWVEEEKGVVTLSRLPVSQIIEDIVQRYTASYPEDKLIIRVRDQSGMMHKIDITEIDDPEHPILDQYSLILSPDTSPLQPDELTEEDFIAFFQDPESSWRPYAAGLPWFRDSVLTNLFGKRLKRLNYDGADGNLVAYISSEPGAGGTTVARALAWQYARNGYPALIAKSLPFTPDSLAISNFLLRAHRKIQKDIFPTPENMNSPCDDQPKNQTSDPNFRAYETPWIVVYDRLHWEYRESELLRFYKELQKSGRPVIILVVTDSTVESTFSEAGTIFRRVATLDHVISSDEARELGRHLNQFLRFLGKARKESQWEEFYNMHTNQHLEGFSAFWITLSFWIQGQYDMSESIQEWMYKSFKDKIRDNVLMTSILNIAAMSSERLPLPINLLPVPKGEFPVSYRLEECRSLVPALGLMPIKEDGNNYWALVHDILGRFLINALFYDSPLRKKLGFGDAKDTEHLRFMILRQISQNRLLGERDFSPIAENFATFVFKIDPNRGRANFAPYWRHVLSALDAMPQPLRHNNRIFLHHTAISRRRISQLNSEIYDVKEEDKATLLERAIDDINYALDYIEYTPGSETDLNLYNSLARAYLDLADVELDKGGSDSLIAELRKLANEATRNAYQESPTSPYVVETYVKNLLLNARSSSSQAVENCIEALGVLFSAILSSKGGYRMRVLNGLAEEVLDTLLDQTISDTPDREPTSAIDVLVKAWAILSKDMKHDSGFVLSAVSEANRNSALEILSNPIGRGNMQVIRLNYQLTCVTQPRNFKKQLEFLEQLEKTEYSISPQQKLEYAILLYQNSRGDEGNKFFLFLRQLWRDSDHFVQVPNRLRWLWTEDGVTPKKVTGFVVSDYGFKAMAKVREFPRQQVVPFRPEEFSLSYASPGVKKIICYVSFGHNGPFLRPVTAYQA